MGIGKPMGPKGQTGSFSSADAALLLMANYPDLSVFEEARRVYIPWRGAMGSLHIGKDEKSL